LRARPADFPIGSMESRAAARAMSANRIEWDPVRAALSRITLEPPTPETSVPSGPAHGEGCSCDGCRIRFYQDSRREKPLRALAPSVQASERIPDANADAERRENVLRALQDVARAGVRESGPTPAWANR